MSIKRSLIRALAYPFVWPFIYMPGHRYKPAKIVLKSYEALIKAEVEATVRKLASDIGQRNALNGQGLLDAEKFIEGRFRKDALKVRKQPFEYNGMTMHNIEGELKGRNAPEEIIIVGAHYDTVYGSPGADDNATGVAALLALPKLLRDEHLSRTIRLVAFANEECPGGNWDTMGSFAYAKECKAKNENIIGMISLEMLGVYFETPGSQMYPKPFNWLYGDVGDFIGFVGSYGSRKWVRHCIERFRSHCDFPSEGVAAPSRFRDINRSDHYSFTRLGYNGLMITDTSNFRNRLYHTEKDTPDIIDFNKLARVTTGLGELLIDLARVER